ncbi:tRNA 2-thiocytidine(32) synthetase TtcA [Vagococcus elongatus]|uniref:tRNA 2-thiocytidine(32) synthetase TtcA n=2 Tax=Vagococcus elongatus TaxID=180344 RepID=A0A430B2C2_9ENTE|nr:tRNA 2-thiocytidine(32) synthetase TtcA [Vagococcus elongatus]
MNYGMIAPNEKIAVGMSGGKDSTTLFYLLDTIRKQKRWGFDFELYPITLDMGMGMDIQPLVDFCHSLGYVIDVVPTDIAPVVFDIRQESNPCSLCANLRRGYLYERARTAGCQKVALGHHLDDAIETYFMNFLIHGKLASFEPMTYLDRTDVTVIRPLIYIEEKEIMSLVKRDSLPVIFNPCPVDKQTKREEMKQLVTRLGKDYKDIRQKFVKGMETGADQNFWTSKLEE